MSRRRKIRLKYKKERVLFSDVLPYEVPLIFSNRYFYRFLVRNQIALDADGHLTWKENISNGAKDIISFIFNKDLQNLKSKQYPQTIPFTYKILHKSNKFRELSIIHPANQIEIVGFYEKYKNLILYYCNQDKFSLRHPNKVACYFYYKDRLHHILLGRKTDKLEMYFNEYENLRTYFSYEHYTNIYKFYESYQYQRAEKKYQKLLKFDIQSCFDSIYTHSIAWALNGGKDTYKEHFGGDDKTMGYLWDEVMRRMNYNETNGIVIGPEFSRVFAEVILQHIDSKVQSELLSKKIINNVDYQCFRYVDDYFFFYNDDKVKEEALTLFVNELKTYKLTISSEKTKYFERPFITDITRAKIEIDKLIDSQLAYNITDKKDLPLQEIEFDLADEDVELYQEEPYNGKESKTELLDAAISNKDSWYIKATEFNKQIKAILVTHQVESKDVYNYALVRISRKIEIGLKKFDSAFKRLSLAIKDDSLDDETKKNCKRTKERMENMLCKFLIEVVDSIFFIHSDCRRVNTTLKVVNILNLIIIALDNDYVIKKDARLVRTPRFSNQAREKVFKKIQDEISLVFQTSQMDKNVQLETLYFLITLKSMRSKFYIKPVQLQKYLQLELDTNNKLKSICPLNALAIVVLLYFMGDVETFRPIQHALVAYIQEKIKSVPEDLRRKQAELVLLTLDIITCPFITDYYKKKICSPMGITPTLFEEISNYLKRSKQKYFFTKWNKVDLTKELNAKISQEVYA